MVATPDLFSAVQNTSASQEPGLASDDRIGFPDPDNSDTENPNPSDTTDPEVPVEVAVGTGVLEAAFVAFLFAMLAWAIQSGWNAATKAFDAAWHSKAIFRGMDPDKRQEASIYVRRINSLRVQEGRAQARGDDREENDIDAEAASHMDSVAKILEGQASVIGQHEGQSAAQAAITLASFIRENAQKVRDDDINIPYASLDRRVETTQDAEVAGLEMLNNMEPGELYESALTVLGIEKGSAGADLRVAQVLSTIGLSERIPDALVAGSPVAAELDPTQQNQYAEKVVDSAAVLASQEQANSGKDTTPGAEQAEEGSTEVALV